MPTSFYIVAVAVVVANYLILKKMGTVYPDAPEKIKRFITGFITLPFLFPFTAYILINMGGERIYKIDSLRSISTWIPFLGGDVNAYNYINQYLNIPDFQRSAKLQNLMDVFGTVKDITYLCLLGCIAAGVILYLLFSRQNNKKLATYVCFGSLTMVCVSCLCYFIFHNTFSDYLLGIGGEIHYAFMVIPIGLSIWAGKYFLDTLEANPLLTGSSNHALWAEMKASKAEPAYDKELVDKSEQLLQMLNQGILTEEQYENALEKLTGGTQPRPESEPQDVPQPDPKPASKPIFKLPDESFFESKWELVKTNKAIKWGIIGGLIVLAVILIVVLLPGSKTSSHSAGAINSDLITEDIINVPEPIQNEIATEEPSVPGAYPEGSTRYLDEWDVSGKSRWELRIMRNEIYARHHYQFKTDDMREYFNAQDWYYGTIVNANEAYKHFSPIEVYNVEFIKRHEK